MCRRSSQLNDKIQLTRVICGLIAGSSPSSSPRTNAVSTVPLLRAITEQQSMEEREAANYQLQTTISGSGDEDHEYEQLLGGANNSQLGWTYVDYMKAAGLDPGDRKYGASFPDAVGVNTPRGKI